MGLQDEWIWTLGDERWKMDKEKSVSEEEIILYPSGSFWVV